ncbi:MAG: hypothetical protein IPG72_16240 [Ardenticatenales bacterium]|nr:hypothetical protein [Ardenticatenales bacterium]
MRRFAALAGSLLFALAVTACGAAPAVTTAVPAAATPFPTSEFADINASATEMTDAMGR